ncbi:PdaC/SigV domain-containing protein [Sinomicrobium sp. M5D2P9]
MKVKNKHYRLGPLPVFLFLILAGCVKSDELSYSSHKIATDSGDCEQNPCAKVKVSFPTAVASTAIADKINTIIDNKIISYFIIDPDAKKEESIEKAVENFKSEYLKDKKMQPDFAFGYEADIQGEVLFKGEKLHSIAFSAFMYTGGAHGYSSLTYLNLDPQTGKEYDNKELFTDMESFKKIAEKKFRKQEKIPEGSNINSTGFWFEDDTYQLPENIGFTKDNIILHYNAYDISSYAEGGKTLEIPLEEAKPHLAIL